MFLSLGCVVLKFAVASLGSKQDYSDNVRKVKKKTLLHVRVNETQVFVWKNIEIYVELFTAGFI